MPPDPKHASMRTLLVALVPMVAIMAAALLAALDTS